MLRKQANGILILILQLIVVFQLQQLLVVADYIPPAKPDGFVYGNRRSFDFDSVLIEAFYDPLCPDSRDSWPPLKQALHHYASRVTLLLHLLPLPYHDNAFTASRALHVVNNLNRSATFHLLESFFKHQEKFYGAPTRNLSRASVEEKIVKFAAKAVGSSYYTSIKNGFNDTTSNIQTRVSFKYAALRGVYGTPFFYVNGFLLPDTGATINYTTWRTIIDPLVGAKKSIKDEEPIRYFL